jgi:predicted DNA-binding transcriptional regulator AlpA
MPITRVSKNALSAFTASLTAPPPQVPDEDRQIREKRDTGIVDVRIPGRLRAEDVMQLLRVSPTTFYDGIKDGVYPPADGRDKRVVWWYSETIQPLVMKPKK